MNKGTKGNVTLVAAWPETFARSPRIDQCAIDAEIILRQQFMFACNRQYRVKQFWQHRIVEQAIPVLAEGRVGPDRIINFQTDKPAIQHVVVNLFHQLPRAADGVENLQQGGANQPLRHH